MTTQPFDTATLDLPPAGLEPALAYLEHHLPGWPYNRTIDEPFLTEILGDFPGVDLLEQIKRFRWYHHNSTPRRNPRLALRGWVANAKAH